MRPSPGRWEIGANSDFMGVSESTWHMGYGGWKLFFAPRIVQGVLNLAQQFPDTLDAQQRHKEIWRYLYDHDAFEPAEALGLDSLLLRIWERIKELSLFSRSKNPPWLDSAREFCSARNITIRGWSLHGLLVEAESPERTAEISAHLADLGFQPVPHPNGFCGILTLWHP